MKKDVRLKFVLLMMLFVGGFVACDDDDEDRERDPSLCSCERCGESRVHLETGREDRGG